MSVTLASLRTEVRTVCGDFGVIKSGSAVDSSTYIFRDDMIDNMIKIILLDLSDYSIDGAGTSISTDFSSDNDRLVVIYSTALALLTSLVDTAYATGDMRLQNKAPTNKLNEVAFKLQQYLDKMEYVWAYDGSTAAIINMGYRWSTQLEGILES